MNPVTVFRQWFRSRCLVGVGLVLSLTGVQALEPVRLNETRSGFVLAESGRPFRVWGVNYDHDTRGEGGRLLEDYWEKEWPTVEQDLREIRDLGANVVRIHLQLGRFMSGPDTARPEALGRLHRLLEVAGEVGLHVDLTGLGCYHKQDVPEWYDALGETDRWEVQARFWTAVARTCKGSPVVFCYDLMNEPIIGGDTSEGWLAGDLGGKYFVQRLTLDDRGRPAPEIAEAWVRRLTGAIRKENPDHLITVGVIPWAMVWPNAKPLFYSPEVAQHLDFVSVHFYPKAGEVGQAVAALKVYDIGKPLVIEEMGPLSCSLEEMDEFIAKSKPIAEGWMSFYWGKTIEEYEAIPAPSIADRLVAGWLRHFREKASLMKQVR